MIGRRTIGATRKKSVADQMTDMLATAAGALAETAVKTVAKRVRKTVAKKTPAPVKVAKTVASVEEGDQEVWQESRKRLLQTKRPKRVQGMLQQRALPKRLLRKIRNSKSSSPGPSSRVKGDEQGR